MATGKQPILELPWALVRSDVSVSLVSPCRTTFRMAAVAWRRCTASCAIASVAGSAANAESVQNVINAQSAAFASGAAFTYHNTVI
jgi:hypothetical protein